MAKTTADIPSNSGQVPEKGVFTPFPPEGFKMPFYYDAVSFFWNYFRVPFERVEPHLEGTGLTPARFTDLGTDEVIVSLNFQNYLSNLGFALSRVLEVEFNIHCYPTSKASETPLVSFRDYLQGQEQTKWIGGFRLHVPADDPVAVKAGRLVFGERKFLTQFAFDIPVPNNPVKAGTEWPWDYTVYDPAYKLPTSNEKPSENPSDFIYRLRATLSPLGQSVLTNPSPMTLYSLLPGGPDPSPPGNGTLNASRWNIFGLDRTWFDIDALNEPIVSVEYGSSDHPMKKDMEAIIRDTRACAVRYFQSPPAAVENRAFWVDGPPE